MNVVPRIHTLTNFSDVICQVVTVSRQLHIRWCLTRMQRVKIHELTDFSDFLCRDLPALRQVGMFNQSCFLAARQYDMTRHRYLRGDIPKVQAGVVIFLRNLPSLRGSVFVTRQGNVSVTRHV